MFPFYQGLDETIASRQRHQKTGGADTCRGQRRGRQKSEDIRTTKDMQQLHWGHRMKIKPNISGNKMYLNHSFSLFIRHQPFISRRWTLCKTLLRPLRCSSVPTLAQHTFIVGATLDPTSNMDHN